MKIYSCILIDDEFPALNLLEAYISKIPFLKVECTFENGIDALTFLNDNDVDIIFSDIQMPGITGTELVQVLKNKPQIILTTAFREFAVKGFELKVTDYIVKPFSFERFLQSVNKAIDNIKLLTVSQSSVPTQKPIDNSNNTKSIFVRTNHKMEKLVFADILYVQSMREYVSIQTVERRFVVNQSMKSMEEVLPKNNFIRVHRSHIIALDKIQSINGNVIEIGDSKINIGGSYRATFFERIETL